MQSSTNRSNPVKPAEARTSGTALSTANGSGALVSIDSRIFKEVNVALSVRLGEVTLTVDEIFALKSGVVLTLDQALGAMVDVLLNGQPIARGEIVAVGDCFGVRVVEMAGPATT